MAAELHITVADIRRAGHCIVPGTRDFFNEHADQLGMDFRGFLKAGGIDAKKLLATGDARAVQVVERTRKARRDG